MTRKEVAEKISAAIAADAMENPTLVAELAKTKEGISDAMLIDVQRALQGESGPVLFPHLRGAVRDLIGNGKADIWAATGEYIGEEPTKPAATAPTTNVWSAISAIVPSIIGGGVALYGAQQQRELEEEKLEAQQAQTALLRQIQAQQTAAAAASAPATASMFGGMSMGTLLMIGAAGLAAIIILPQVMGKKGRR